MTFHNIKIDAAKDSAQREPHFSIELVPRADTTSSAKRRRGVSHPPGHEQKMTTYTG